LDELVGRSSRGGPDVVELPGRTPAAADLAELEKLIGRSSLGTPGAVELRSRTPAQLVERVAQRCEAFSGLGDDLAGLVREKADLRSANLRDADLRDARLMGADLRHADLSGADLSGAHLYGADLRHADLSGADLSGVQLDRANLGNANLAGAILLDASLIRTQLEETNLDGAALTRAALDRARLVGATMCHATLYRSSLQHAIIGRTDLTGTYLSKARLDDALIMESILRECEFSDATLRRTRIVRVDLTSCLGLVPVQLVKSDVGVDTILPDGWAAELWPQSHLDGVVPAPWVHTTDRWQNVGSSELAGRTYSADTWNLGSHGPPRRRPGAHRFDRLFTVGRWPSHDYAGRLEPEQTSGPSHTDGFATELYQDSGVDFARTGSKPRIPSESGGHQNTVVPPGRPPTMPLARSPSRPRTDAVRPARHARRQRKGRHRAVGRTAAARVARVIHTLPILAAIVAAIVRVFGGVQSPPQHDIQPTMVENTNFEHEMSTT
jgi:uncharacterized protein YjbI with pentapeptide repeats